MRDELKTGALVEHAIVPGLFEDFYAMSVPRRFTLPLLRELLARPELDVLRARRRVQELCAVLVPDLTCDGSAVVRLAVAAFRAE